MRICVFDTETISVDKPFCYNVGFVIFDTDTSAVLEKTEFVIEQIWHNMALFSTAYYADKRPIYVKRMRGKKIQLDKWGRVCQYMIRVFKNYNVECAYAYNSNFDERVFNFNCDYFKTQNPFDTVPILDIRGNVHKVIAFTPLYQNFCEKNNLFTETGNYSTTAEALTKFIRNDIEFIEEHTALADSEIELDILKETIRRGCEWGKEYKVYQSIKRQVLRSLKIIDKENNCHDYYYYNSIRINKDKTIITLK